jgi:serine/threonine protein kinase
MTIGNYNIGYVIGKGADAEVRVATEKSQNGRQLAVKILKINNEDEKYRFRRELEVTKSLAHENIIKFYDVSEEDGAMYIFMEKGGKTLEKYAEECGGENGMDEIVVKNLFLQLVNAVNFIHSKGICQNVLVDENTHKVVLIDFGYCGLVQNESSVFNDSVGSPLFNSPEKILNQVSQSKNGYCGKSSDLWALGVCLSYMLNGCYPFFPFGTMSMEELTQQILSSDVFLSPTVSIDANDLISKLLDKNPLRRITISQVLDHPWLNSNLQSVI